MSRKIFLWYNSCIIISYINCSNDLLLPNGEDYYDKSQLERCVEWIIAENSESEDLNVVLNSSLKLNFPLIRLSEHDDDSVIPITVIRETLINPKAYIINSDEESFNYALERIKNIDHFNPRAKFLIILPINDVITGDKSALSIVFKILSENYIAKVVIIATPALDLYTYHPYKTRSDVKAPSTKEELIGKCPIVPKHLLFRDFVRKDWAGTILRVSHKSMSPYVIRPLIVGERGIEIFFLETIKTILNFEITYEYFKGPYNDPRNSSSYPEAFGHIMRREFDVLLGGYYMKNREFLDMDMAFCFLHDGIHLVVPKSRRLQQSKRIMLAFRLHSWIFLYSSLVIFTTVYYLNTRFYHNKGEFWYLVFGELLFYFCGILVEHSTKIPREKALKILLGTWVCFSLIMSTAFKSQTMNILSGIAYEAQIHSLQEIVDSGLEIFMHRNYAVLYAAEKASPLEKYVYKNNVHCGNVTMCLTRTAEKRDSVSAALGRYIWYTMPLFLDEENGDEKLFVLKEPFYPVSIHMVFSKGYPIFDQIDKLFIGLASSGFVTRSYRYIKHKSTLNYYKKLHNSFREQRNGLNVMSLPFLILRVGLVVSFLVFICEFFCEKARNKFKNTK